MPVGSMELAHTDPPQGLSLPTWVPREEEERGVGGLKQQKSVCVGGGEKAELCNYRGRGSAKMIMGAF